MNTNEPTKTPSNTGAITFAITALVFLALGCLMLAMRPGFLLGETLTGHGQAWIRLMIYGFGLPAVFGAVYWALPKAFGVPLYSPQTVFLHYGFHLAGLVVVMLLPFVPELPQASMGATFLACGGVVFVFNVALSLRRMERPDAASAFLSTLMVWVVLALFLGVPFASEPPLPLLAGTNWSAGWLVFAIAGIFFNAQLGLALRVTPLAVGAKSERTPAAWYALAILNLGVAWMVAAATFGTPAFLLLCTAIFLVGSLIYLADFWAILQRRHGSTALGWDVKILLTAVWMIPAAALVLMYAVWHHMLVAVPEVAADAATAVAAPVIEGPAPIMVMPLDWTTGLVGLLAAAVPGLIAVIFQLQKLQLPDRADDSPRERVAGQLLLAAFFNYAVGAGLVVVGAWGSEDQMLGLGAVFLVVGSLGFLGCFLHNLGRSGAAESAADQAMKTA
ncbi:MAG: hypothetical protein ACOYOL_10000 [Chthoniobacterales bacterium]